MSMNRHCLRRSAAALLAISWMAAGAAQVSPQRTTGDAEARYQRERAACLAGDSTQDRGTCLKEAGAALAQARRGALTDRDTDYEAHKRQRCTPLPQPERDECLARMSGQGTVSGSVGRGGVLRELVTVEPATMTPSGSNVVPAPKAP